MMPYLQEKEINRHRKKKAYHPSFKTGHSMSYVSW